MFLHHATTATVLMNTKESWNIYLLSKTENKFWLPRFTYNALQSVLISSLYIYYASTKTEKKKEKLICPAALRTFLPGYERAFYQKNILL